MMTNMMSLIWADFADGDVQVHSEMLNVTFGKRAEIRCTTTSEHDVEWEFMREGASDKLTICSERQVTDEFVGKYECHKDGRNHTLVIVSVGFDHAGNYTCIESAGHSTNSATARLVVSSK